MVGRDVPPWGRGRVVVVYVLFDRCGTVRPVHMPGVPMGVMGGWLPDRYPKGNPKVQIGTMVMSVIVMVPAVVLVDVVSVLVLAVVVMAASVLVAVMLVAVPVASLYGCRYT